MELIEGRYKSWVICKYCGADGPMSYSTIDAIGRWNNAWYEMSKHERVNKNES